MKQIGALFFGLIVLLAILALLFSRAPWDRDEITARAGGGDWENYGTSFGEIQPQNGRYVVGSLVTGGWNALKSVSDMESQAQPGNVEITINRLTNIFGTDVSKGQAGFSDEDVANYAQAGFPNGGYEHAFARVSARTSGEGNSSNWQLTFAWNATTPGYYQIDITPRNDQARSLGWVAVRVEGAAPVVSYPTPYTTPYSYPTPAYSYPTPYSYPYPTPAYTYPTPYTTPFGGYTTPYSYPYPSPYSYPTPSYTYPTPAYTTPYVTPYATPYSTPYAYPSPQTILIQAPPQQVVLAPAAAQPSVLLAPSPKELPKTGSEVLLAPGALLGLWLVGRKIRRKFRVV